MDSVGKTYEFREKVSLINKISSVMLTTNSGCSILNIGPLDFVADTEHLFKCS